VNFSVASLLAAYRSGAIRPTEVLQESLRRINQQSLRPIWICLTSAEQAAKRAAQLEQSDPSKLPLYGIPFAVKDNIDVSGLPTTAGCPSYAYAPQRTAPVVQRLLDAGAMLIGKTNLDQFATGLVGVRSPYGACSSVFHPDYISGGSSSGSAVSVARDMVSFSLGTDTAGSGRVPAAFNGLIGLKPTRGLLSTSGVVPACRTLDCVTVFTRRAEDAEAVLRVAQGFDATDPFSRIAPTGAGAAPWLASKFRFGVPPDAQLQFFGDTEAADLFAKSIDHLRSIGGEPVEVDFAPFRDAANLLYSGPWVAERLAAIRPFLETIGADVHPVVRRIIEGGAKYSAVDAYQGLYKLGALRQQSLEQWNRMDVLAVPTTGTIYKIAEVEADPVQLNTNLGYYTNFVNLLDLSGVAVPAGVRPNGLPFGATLIGPAFSESALLQLARRLEGEKATLSTPHSIQVAVVGAHLEGQPLNYQLRDRGARLVRICKTSREYKLYALANTQPPKPGLVRVPGFDGPGIEIEIWSVPEDRFGSFVAEIPSPLGIGTVVTDSGDSVKCFICEPHAINGAMDITSYGGWRAYRR